MGRLKYKIKNAFREFLVPHSKSLEFRAELLTLMVLSNEKISDCEKNLIKEIASTIYEDNITRAEVLYETIEEFHAKIVENNGLEYNDLIKKIKNDTEINPRFAKKIEIEQLDKFKKCMNNEEEIIFHSRIIEFLINLKEEYGEL